MAKVATRYLETHPTKLIEKGFHPDRNMVSESLFALANEYCGVRAFFEEGSSLPSLIGTYYNGIIEKALEDTPNAYKGIVKRGHFTINSINFLKVRIEIDGEVLDLGKSKIKDFERILDMDDGLLVRRFTWLVGDNGVEITFRRLLSMTRPEVAYQSISFIAKKAAHLNISFELDGTILHWGNHCYWDRGSEFTKDNRAYVYETTPTTNQSLLSLMEIRSSWQPKSSETEEKRAIIHYSGDLEAGKAVEFERFVSNIAGKKRLSEEQSLAKAKPALEKACRGGFAQLLLENSNFFAESYQKSLIEIDGDPADQQGIRFCLFHLIQTYHGLEEDNNIGAKGLTGEAYSGHAFWDSETYCLPYYLFSDKKIAKNLLLFRYHTLEQAKARAKDLDCVGACYPIATRNGEEACALWQHASTQIQPTSAVGYAIQHYMTLYEDDAFMRDYGFEMLLEISKFLYSRGQWNQHHTAFGYYGVMGPDEFQVMVNHNTYTNLMGKKIIEYTLGLIDDSKYRNESLLCKAGYNDELIRDMRTACGAMRILYDEKTKLFEQHDGFYDLPHIDVDAIPPEEFPLYSHWSYDRIYRNDMIKQPDVLMFLFLYNQDFSDEIIRANYEFYEPRCIHESSLSPSIHSILAEQIGKEDEALSFFGFATRLDLDDYNRNTCEGLHMTSIAAAWMNIVYGFLGLRSERTILKINPRLPSRWNSYRVTLHYREATLSVEVRKDQLILHSDKPVQLYVGNELLHLDGEKTFLR